MKSPFGISRTPIPVELQEAYGRQKPLEAGQELIRLIDNSSPEKVAEITRMSAFNQLVHAVHRGTNGKLSFGEINQHIRASQERR